jgi:hypothetical protein
LLLISFDFQKKKTQYHSCKQCAVGKREEGSFVSMTVVGAEEEINYFLK